MTITNENKKGLYPVPGYEGLYSVTKDGEVWSHKSEIFLTQETTKDGYKRVDLCRDGVKKHMKVHRIVAITLIPNNDPLNKTEVHHEDEDRANNSVENLRWVTHAEHLRIHNKLKEVGCLNDGEQFCCVEDAAEFYGIKKGDVYKVLSGVQATTHGLRFEYI